MLINPANIPTRTTSIYPEIFKPVMAGRSKQSLGDAAGLKIFGVNLVKLAPGSCSALKHWHTKQDEFIYVIEEVNYPDVDLMAKHSDGGWIFTHKDGSLYES